MTGNSPNIHQLMNGEQNVVHTYNGLLLNPKNEVQSCLRDSETPVLHHPNTANIAIK